MGWRWPWSRQEDRESGASFEEAVLRAIESEAAGTAADTGATAAVEAASGALSRAFASARISGPGRVRDAVTPGFLAQVGRDLIRSGQSLHVIDVRRGRLSLLPAASWHFEGDAHPDTWTVRATYYGPSSSSTRHLPFSGVVFVPWGSTPGQPYTGTGPLRWAALTARLQSETERSLADEARGPVGQLISVPQQDGDLDTIKTAVKAARGKAVLLETTAGGWGAGRAEAPRADWKPNRLGPQPDDALVRSRRETFDAVLASCGTPPAMFDDSDGTAQRESLRRYLTTTVIPLGRVLAHELEKKLEAPISFDFSDMYAHDLVGRASAFQRLVAGGVPVNEALATSGLLAE